MEKLLYCAQFESCPSKAAEEIYPEVMLRNLITDRPSDSHPIHPRRGTYLFPASDCIKFVLFLTLLEKNTLGECMAHTGGCREPKALYLCLDGSGRSVLLGTDSVLWSLAPLCIPPVPLTHTPHPCWAFVASCVFVYICICMCLVLYMYTACSCLYIL